jgi:hypothetical protein
MATYHPIVSPAESRDEKSSLARPASYWQAAEDPFLNRKTARPVCGKFLCLATPRKEKTRKISSSGPIAGVLNMRRNQKLMVS